MSAIDNARAAVERWQKEPREHPGFPSEADELADYLGAKLEALITEHERLTAAPTEEARESLANLIPLGFTERDPVRNVVEAADRIIAAGWRPIHTDGA